MTDIQSVLINGDEYVLASANNTEKYKDFIGELADEINDLVKHAHLIKTSFNENDLKFNMIEAEGFRRCITHIQKRFESLLEENNI